MMVVFEVYLARGKSAEDLLSAETRKETGAQIMSIEEAKAVGFSGLAPLEGVGEVRLIAVRRSDAPWVHRSLEGSDVVASFRVHDVE
ncbi:hypothetical protein [Chondromyces apiculatus]|uniref:Uncharacterized protein n=1 Tax=Chondromyces apiculatus DSM 436 TaxID=1192034 RepID=A0A017TAM7_9BACT|nr:hypothetical protein [Chondromyces apiculatus]EYF06338.1 Hypothetical protein CAP_2216 [Chondromyces apiculatus DSM 436]